MKLRKRQKVPVMRVYPEDHIVLSHKDNRGVERVLLRDEIGRKMTITEAAIFDVEPEDFEGVTGGIGGAFLEVAEGDEHGR